MPASTGGRLSSDGGLLVLREIDRRLEVADRLAACIEDRRDPDSTVHTLADSRPRRDIACSKEIALIITYMNEHRIHRIFQLSVLLKGAHAAIECVGGVALALVSTSTITDLVNALTKEELIADPKDFIATHLRVMAEQFSVGTKHFYAFYLLSHGVSPSPCSTSW